MAKFEGEESSTWQSVDIYDQEEINDYKKAMWEPMPVARGTDLVHLCNGCDYPDWCGPFHIYRRDLLEHVAAFKEKVLQGKQFPDAVVQRHFSALKLTGRLPKSINDKKFIAEPKFFDNLWKESKARYAKLLETKMHFGIHQLSSEFKIKYLCTDMAGILAKKLMLSGCVTLDELSSIFVEHANIEKQSNRSTHAALDEVQVGPFKIVSFQEVGGAEVVGPSILQEPTSKQQSIDFFYAQVLGKLEEYKDKPVGFVACGGSASFGGCVRKVSGREHYSFLDTHQSEGGGDGAYLYTGFDKSELDKFLNMIILTENTPFGVLLFKQ